MGAGGSVTLTPTLTLLWAVQVCHASMYTTYWPCGIVPLTGWWHTSFASKKGVPPLSFFIMVVHRSSCLTAYLPRTVAASIHKCWRATSTHAGSGERGIQVTSTLFITCMLHFQQITDRCHSFGYSNRHCCCFFPCIWAFWWRGHLCLCSRGRTFVISWCACWSLLRPFV